MARFEHAHARLDYTLHGAGRPLVLVHGLGSSARDWEYQVPVFAEHYQVITLDLRGHGLSERPRERYSIKGFTADLCALLDFLETGPVHFVGLSMGGMIGFQLAVDRPDLLRSLCIVNSGPEVKVRSAGDYWQWFKRWSVARLLSMRTIGKALGKSLFPKPEQASLRKEMQERWAGNDKHAYLASFNAIVNWGVREHLPGIRCPTLIVSADHDYTPVALKQEYCEELPLARLVVIEDSRHATPLDQPEAFNGVLLDFLSEVETTTQDSQTC